MIIKEAIGRQSPNICQVCFLTNSESVKDKNATVNSFNEQFVNMNPISACDISMSITRTAKYLREK